MENLISWAQIKSKSMMKSIKKVETRFPVSHTLMKQKQSSENASYV